jgi:hypothetical protein
VLRDAADGGAITAARARAATVARHRSTGRSGGNGSLMRTAPVALAYLDDESAMVAAARAISELTHVDPDAGDACVLWCSAIRHAVHTGELDVRVGLRHLEADRRPKWVSLIEAAEAGVPSSFPNNGWVVTAFQAAWSAIVTTEAAGAEHFQLAVDAAVRAGFDTDTVAAIAGGLIGAAYGASAVPLQWRRLLHGWPGITARGVVALASAIARGGKPDTFDYRYSGFTVGALAPHPYDPQVLLGGIGALWSLPQGVDAVVSLCRVGDDAIPTDMPHVEVRLIDREDSDENPHLDYVLAEAVRAVEELRAEGRTVLVHCVEALSRTPTVAALYGMRVRGVGAEEALRDVLAVLPGADPNAAFQKALRRFESGGAA